MFWLFSLSPPLLLLFIMAMYATTKMENKKRFHDIANTGDCMCYTFCTKLMRIDLSKHRKFEQLAKKFALKPNLSRGLIFWRENYTLVHNNRPFF